MLEKINTRVPEANLSSNKESLLEIFDRLDILHLPMLNQGQYLGLLEKNSLQEDYILQHPSSELKLLSIKFYNTDTVASMWRNIAHFGLTALPIFNKDEEYQYTIHIKDLLSCYRDEYELNIQSSVIILNSNLNNFSQTTLTEILEEQHRALEHFIKIVDKEKEQFILILWLNDECAPNIISELDRHHFSLMAVYNPSGATEPLKDRYDELMHYLNV